MQSEFIKSPSRCQPFSRIGRAFLNRRGSSSYVGVPVLSQDRDALTWALAGVVRVWPQDVRLKAFPETKRGRRNFVRKAVWKTREALAGRAA